MNADVHRWARTCLQCQCVKVTTHTVTPALPFHPPDSRFAHKHIDLVGPLPPSRCTTYLLTCVDRFTCWPEAIPIPDITVDTVAKAFVAGWVSRFGCSAVVITDRGRRFQSALFNALAAILEYATYIPPPTIRLPTGWWNVYTGNSRQLSPLTSQGNIGPSTFPSSCSNYARLLRLTCVAHQPS